MNGSLKKSMAALLLILVGAGTAHSAQLFIQISSRRANIRFGPTTGSPVVVTARRGDIFELKDETGDWYQIRMFSGESRYLHKSLAVKISYKPEAPRSFSRRRDIFKAFREIDAKMAEEADARYPPDKNLRRNLEYTQILEDRYKLEVIHQFDAQPPVYRSIVIEGNQKGW
jgi:uncharacterized protein YgiM (DUF1202 family)